MMENNEGMRVGGGSERSSGMESQYYQDRDDLTVDHSQMCYDEPSQMHQDDDEFAEGEEIYGSE